MKRIPVPSFELDFETNEVKIPYDQFHTFMNEVLDSIETLEVALRELERIVEAKMSNEQIRAHLERISKTMRGMYEQ